jgi:hypothetical protein
MSAPHFEAMQEEVQGYAEAIARIDGCTVHEAWDEALQIQRLVLRLDHLEPLPPANPSETRPRP